MVYLSTKIEHYINRFDLNYCDENIEMQWIETHLPNQKKYFIGNIYRPPNSDTSEALKNLNIRFETINQIARTEIFCLGDFNIDLLKPSKDRKEFYDILSENGLEQLIEETTRQTTKTKTISDLTLTNRDCILESGVLFNNISDHFQVYMIRKHTKKVKYPTTFLGRNYLNNNTEILQDSLELIDWTSFTEEENPNLMWEIYLQNITAQIDKLYPIRNYNINQKKEPWINDEIVHMIIEKDRLLLQAKLLNTEETWNTAKRAKNRTKIFIQKAKSNYISESLEINKQNPKTFWRTINNLLPNKKQSDSHILLKDLNNNQIIPDDEIPDYINTYFTSIGPKLAENNKKKHSSS